jgi:adenylate cyclase
MSGDHSLASVLYAQVADKPVLGMSGADERRRRLDEDLAVMRGVASRNDGQVLRADNGRVQMVFGNSVHAVISALEMQGIFTRTYNSGPDKLNYRYGIHFGEVSLTADQASGEAAEIASRVQQMARPGAIWVSAAVMDGIKGKLPVVGVPKGFRVLKDLGKTVAVFELIQGLGPIAKVARRWKLSKSAPAWAGVLGR